MDHADQDTDERGTATRSGPVEALTTADRGSALPRGTVLLLGAAAAVVAAVGMYWGSWLLGPLLLALIIVIAVYPIKTWLERHGWPSWTAVLSLLVIIFGAILLLSAFLVASAGQLATVLGQNSGRAQELIASASRSLSRFGIDPSLSAGTANQVNPERVIRQIGALLSGLGSVASSLVFILALLLFLVAESGGVTRRLDMIRTERPHMTEALAGFASGTRNYLLVTTVFGGIVAVLDTVALAIIGIPLALLWGVLAFITNYIPNIGFIIGLAPPALLALLLGGWQEALIVVVVYCVLNAVVQSLIQPHFTGDAVGLSTVITFVALLFWAWVLGPLGALLAIPATLLIKAVLVDCDPSAQWVEALIGSSGPTKNRAESPEEGTGAGAGAGAGDAAGDAPDAPVADVPGPAIAAPSPRTAPAP